MTHDQALDMLAAISSLQYRASQVYNETVELFAKASALLPHEDCICRTESCSHPSRLHDNNGRCRLCDQPCWL